MNNIDTKEYAKLIYRLNWLWSQINVLAEVMDSLLVDANVLTNKMQVLAFREDKIRIRSIVNNVKNTRSLIKLVQAKHLLDDERVDALEEVSDIVYELVHVFNTPTIDIDSTKNVLEDYIKIIESLNERNESHDDRIAELEDVIQKEIATNFPSKE